MKYVLQIATMNGKLMLRPVDGVNHGMDVAKDIETNGLTQTFPDGFVRVPKAQIAQIVCMEANEDGSPKIPENQQPKSEGRPAKKAVRGPKAAGKGVRPGNKKG